MKSLKTRKVVITAYPRSRNCGRYMMLYPVYSTRECERRKRQITRGIIKASV